MYWKGLATLFFSFAEPNTVVRADACPIAVPTVPEAHCQAIPVMCSVPPQEPVRDFRRIGPRFCVPRLWEREVTSSRDMRRLLDTDMRIASGFNEAASMLQPLPPALHFEMRGGGGGKLPPKAVHRHARVRAC